MNFRIIIAEDEDITRKQLLHALKREGYDAVGARNGPEALGLMEREHFDLLVTDVRMPGMNGIELLEKVKERDPRVEVLVVTGFASVDSAVEAMKKGAYEYITKPFNLDELIMKIKNIHERKLLKKENLALRTFFGMSKGVSIIARSESMKRIMATVEEIKDSDSPVLLTGEKGVGKSIIAKIIHFTSRRESMPFLSLNCSTMTEDLLSAELFGYERTSASGATRTKKGLMEVADGGTLFVDAVGDLPSPLQAKLLNVAEDGRFSMEGRLRPVEINVRLLSAWDQDMRELIREGRFMEDLYFRLKGVEITVPPLRERREDIEPLCTFFLQKYRSNSGGMINGFTEEATGVLENYSYPGNVRELENIIERAAILEKGPLITPESLPTIITKYRIETYQTEQIKTIDEVSRDYASKVLDLVEGDKAEAARLLGIPEISLWKLLKRR
ncbi:MAG TPA: sigma-54 dependent transcriptional regulator [Thermodesulfovibrionales bacterium]|jgi:DNA-binding NtrC family response regulator|nr:sigma-54 dependent transcriptional regulator [Thermodesulfovibrionales bacterium]